MPARAESNYNFKTSMKPIFPILMLVVCWLAVGCDHSPNMLPTAQMKIGGKTFDIEIAATESQQETGLMKRDSMPDDHGMIFVFPNERERGFWMKNTRIPLDILFLDSSGKIVSIHQMIPYDERLTPSDFPARYAIELNKGAAESAGVKVGDRITIPPEAKSK